MQFLVLSKRESYFTKIIIIKLQLLCPVTLRNVKIKIQLRTTSKNKKSNNNSLSTHVYLGLETVCYNGLRSLILKLEPFHYTKDNVLLIHLEIYQIMQFH